MTGKIASRSFNLGLPTETIAAKTVYIKGLKRMVTFHLFPTPGPIGIKEKNKEIKRRHRKERMV